MSLGAVAVATGLPLALAAVAYLFAVGVAVVAAIGRAPRIVASQMMLERGGLIALAAALVLALADRHLLVASSGLAPDDALATVATAATLAVALRAPPSARLRSYVYALVLAAYALIGIALLLGKPYHTDAAASVHHNALQILAGRHPYADFDMHDALARFGLGDLTTDLEDGTALRSHNYPVLAALVLVPFVALGLDDVRVVHLAMLLALVVVVALSAREPWRPFAIAAAIGNVALMRQFVLAGIDVFWALMLVAAWLARSSRWSALALGVALASRQQAWVIAPFLVVWAWRERGSREAAIRAAIALAVLLAIHLPFLVADPIATLRGPTDIVLLPLERHGVGPSMLLELPRAAYLALAATLYMVALWWYGSRSGRGALVIPVAPLLLGWRALQSYFALMPLLLFVEEEDG